jgi:archaellum component FlaF (FlaF/FlaG flagellin family)
VSDLTAAALMVIATLIALSIIWGTYVRQYVQEAKEAKAALAVRR